MKKLLFYIFLLIPYSITFAQIRIYSKLNEFKYDNHTYACKTGDDGLVHLYCKEYYNPNHAPNIPQVYTATGEEYIEYVKPLLKEETSTKPQCYNIVYQAFKQEILNSKDEDLLGIMLYFDSFTGKVYRVEFVFGEPTFYNRVDMKTYAQIESKIKEKVRFKTTDEGKKLNYVSLMWTQDPSKKPQFE